MPGGKLRRLWPFPWVQSGLLRDPEQPVDLLTFKIRQITMCASPDGPKLGICIAVWQFVPIVLVTYNIFDEKFDSKQNGVTNMFDLRGRSCPLGSFF